jgi:hypothetical protein
VLSAFHPILPFYRIYNFHQFVNRIPVRWLSASSRQDFINACLRQARIKPGCDIYCLMPFEILDVFLVLFCRLVGIKGAEVSAFIGFWIVFHRVEPIVAGFKFTYHDVIAYRSTIT